MLFAVSRDDLKMFRILALVATSIFMVQAVMLGTLSLIVSNLCFGSLYTYKLLEGKKKWLLKNTFYKCLMDALD